MRFYTQKVSGNIGNTQWTVSRYGCLGTCFGMILEANPREIFNHAEYFNSDGLLTNPQKLCDDFGGVWDSNRSDIGLRPVIVETRFDGSLHFVVWDGNRFYDPLSADGHPLRDYKIISFRNVRKKDEMIPQNLVDGNLFESNGMVLYHIPDPQTADKYFGNWSVRQPLTNIVPEKVKVEQVIVEKPVIVEKDILTEEEKTQFIAEYEKDHPPIYQTIYKEKELADEQKNVLNIWDRINNFIKSVSHR